MKKSLVFALLVCCAAPVVPVHAETVYCWNCSDKVTQALDRITNLEQLQMLLKEYDEAIQQTAAQLEIQLVFVLVCISLISYPFFYKYLIKKDGVPNFDVFFEKLLIGMHALFCSSLIFLFLLLFYKAIIHILSHIV